MDGSHTSLIEPGIVLLHNAHRNGKVILELELFLSTLYIEQSHSM